jgi:hypothetical protein
MSNGDFPRPDAKRVRQALIATAQRAYEDTRIRGLFAEGAFEAALDAMRTLDLATLADARRLPRATDTPG